MNLNQRIGSQIDDPASKRKYVRRLFAGVAHRYDLTNDVMSMGLHRRWKKRVLEIAEIRSGQVVLDLAAGTGDLARSAVEAAGGSLDVVATDLTPEMLSVGVNRPGPDLLGWVGGDAEALPFPDSTFDRVLIGYGLRNFANLDNCLREILRCLKPGGRLVTLDFGKPRSPLFRRAYLAYLDVSTRVVGWALHRNAESYVYIPESLRRFTGQRGIARMMEESGYVGCRAEDLLMGIMGINVGERPPGVTPAEPLRVRASRSPARPRSSTT
ncbi:MAG: ubiquinone/menaquinone biosynthesis methyltransferase [Gemmatimonadota bacterium]